MEIVKFRTYVEPPEPMRGLEVPPQVVESFGQGKRPRVRITINGHSWRSRVAVMRGRHPRTAYDRLPDGRKREHVRRGSAKALT